MMTKAKENPKILAYREDFARCQSKRQILLLSFLLHRVRRMENLFDQLNEYLHNYSFDSEQIDKVREKTLESLLWNDEQTEIIAIDQNSIVNQCREIVRQCLHQLIDFTWEYSLTSINDECFSQLEQMKIYHKKRSNSSTTDLIQIDRDEYIRLRYLVERLQLLIRSPSCLID